LQITQCDTAQGEPYDDVTLGWPALASELEARPAPHFAVGSPKI